MPRTPLSAVEAAFVRLVQDSYGLTDAKARVAQALAPLFDAHAIAPGTTGVSIEEQDGALVLVTADEKPTPVGMWLACHGCDYRYACRSAEVCLAALERSL